MKLGMSKCVLLLAFFGYPLCGCNSPPQPTNDRERPKPLTAQEILNRMVQEYATCKTYRDKGIVSTLYSSSDGSTRTRKIMFSTAFVRPDRFRFEFTTRSVFGEEMPYIVHSSHGDTRTWWYINPGVEEEESLGMAIAGATGVSSGSAHTVAVLLMEETIGGNSMSDMKSLTRLPDAGYEGSLCYRVTGETRGGANPTLWIDKNTFLLRRIDWSREFAEFRTNTITTYAPEVNV